MAWLDVLVVALILGGIAFAWFSVGPPDWYMPREPELPCPVCGNPNRNCYGRLTSDCLFQDDER